MKPKIEKGIPVPPPYSRHEGLTDLLRQMEVGDSVVLDSQPNVYQYAIQLKMKFAQRKIAFNKYRIWRIE